MQRQTRLMAIFLTVLLSAGSASLAFNSQLSNDTVRAGLRSIERCGGDASCMAGAFEAAAQKLGRKPDYQDVKTALLKVAADLRASSKKASRSSARYKKRLARHKRDEVRVFSAMFAKVAR